MQHDELGRCDTNGRARKLKIGHPDHLQRRKKMAVALLKQVLADSHGQIGKHVGCQMQNYSLRTVCKRETANLQRRWTCSGDGHLSIFTTEYKKIIRRNAMRDVLEQTHRAPRGSNSILPQ